MRYIAKNTRIWPWVRLMMSVCYSDNVTALRCTNCLYIVATLRALGCCFSIHVRKLWDVLFVPATLSGTCRRLCCRLSPCTVSDQIPLEHHKRVCGRLRTDSVANSLTCWDGLCPRLSWFVSATFPEGESFCESRRIEFGLY